MSLVGLVGCPGPSNSDAGSDAGDASPPSDHPEAGDTGSHDVATPDAVSMDATEDTGPEASTEDAASEASTEDAADVTMADAVTADVADAGPDAPAATTCGSAPYVTLSGDFVQAGSTTPVAGGTLQPSICPGTTIMANAAGHYVGRVSANQALYGVFSAPGYLTNLSEEAQFTADPPMNRVQMVTAANAAVGLPGYTPGTATVLIDHISVASTASAGCMSQSGVTFSVPGHIEAHVAYYTGLPPDGGAPTSTGANGTAVISNLVPTGSPEFITITGTKSGCTVEFAYTDGNGATLTGRIPIMADDITWVHPQIR